MKRMTMTAGIVAAILFGTANIAQAQGWGVDQFSAPNGRITELEHIMGHRFGAWSVYAPLDSGARGTRVAGQALRAGQDVYLNITAQHAVGGRKLPYCWAAIARGTFDGMLRTWAAGIRAAGNQSHLTITIAHEPMGKSNANQPKCAGSTGAVYKAMFIHMTRVLRANGVTARFAVVFSGSNYLAYEQGNHRDMDPYVPWGYFQVLGADLYKRTHDAGVALAKVHAFVAWRHQHSASAHMPALVGEMGVSSNDGGASVTYLTDAVQVLRAGFGAQLLEVNWNVKGPYNPLNTRAMRDAWLRASRLAW